MNDTSAFYPPRKAGVIFHVISILVLILCGVIGIVRITSTQPGPVFIIYLFLIISAILLVPLLIYRLSYLQNAVYILERDSLRLQWGLRVEVIPSSTILWVQKADHLTEPIRYPLLRWPGSVLGTRRLSRDTPVEFLASSSRDLVLVATYECVYAISPSEPEVFVNTYQGFTELGSLSSPEHRSEHPTSLLTNAWTTPTSRNMILTSILIHVILIIWIGLTTPTNSNLELLFSQNAVPDVYTPRVRLTVFPMINTLFLTINIVAGLFIFRREKQRPLAYLLWGTSIVVSILFLVATFITLRGP